MSSGGSGAALDHHHPLGRPLVTTADPNNNVSKATTTSIETSLARASRAYSGSRVSRDVFAIRRNCRRTCSIGRSTASDGRCQTGESSERNRPPGQAHDLINSSAVEPTSLISTGDAVLNCASLSAWNSGAASARPLDLMASTCMYCARCRSPGAESCAASGSSRHWPALPTALRRGNARRSSGWCGRTCAATASRAPSGSTVWSAAGPQAASRRIRRHTKR